MDKNISIRFDDDLDLNLDSDVNLNSDSNFELELHNNFAVEASTLERIEHKTNQNIINISNVQDRFLLNKSNTTIFSYIKKLTLNGLLLGKEREVSLNFLSLFIPSYNNQMVVSTTNLGKRLNEKARILLYTNYAVNVTNRIKKNLYAIHNFMYIGNTRLTILNNIEMLEKRVKKLNFF